jgi:DNA primase
MSPVASNKSSALGAGAAKTEHLREAVILATLIATPAVIVTFEPQVERMDCVDQDHAMLRDAILRHAEAEDVKAAIFDDIGAGPLEKLFSQTHVKISPSVRRAGDVDVATMCLGEELGKLAAKRGHDREVRDGMEENHGQSDESLTWRLSQAAKAIDTSVRPESDDTADFVKVENGSMLNKDERSAFDKLLENMVNTRPGKGNRE